MEFMLLFIFFKRTSVLSNSNDAPNVQLGACLDEFVGHECVNGIKSGKIGRL